MFEIRERREDDKADQDQDESRIRRPCPQKRARGYEAELRCCQSNVRGIEELKKTLVMVDGPPNVTH